MKSQPSLNPQSKTQSSSRSSARLLKVLSNAMRLLTAFSSVLAGVAALRGAAALPRAVPRDTSGAGGLLSPKVFIISMVGDSAHLAIPWTERLTHTLVCTRSRGMVRHSGFQHSRRQCYRPWAVNAIP